ncbi:MAG: peptidylprolyl isomerase [Gemmatimonadales bacterium]|nr:MAG: peptidylprolyl isomerase [Gemmatimonadales bacterium]
MRLDLRSWIALPLVLALSACASTASTTPETGPPAPEPEDAPSVLLDPTAPELNRTAPDTFKVLFETTAGDFVVEVYRDWAPLGADRFFNLVDHGFYDGLRFYRVIPNFMAQFGIHADPEISAAWRGTRIPDDPVEASNERGTITFATGGPDTRTVQLFINRVDNERLDPMGFAPFGRVTGGMDSVDRIYDGYGEGAPRGDGPSQGRIQEAGEPYLAAEFPRLDMIHRAWVLTP